MPKVKPHIILDKETFSLIFPYNSACIKGVKQAYPPGERDYDYKTKVWTIVRSETNVNLAKSLVEKHFNMKAQMFSKEGDLHATYETALDTTSKYTILDLTEEASPAEIKRAFYRIAKRLHPDVSDADAEFFQLAKKAYDTLKDPLKRKKYDLARKLIGYKKDQTGLRLTSRDLMT